MNRRGFLGALIAVAGLRLTPDMPTVGIDWATGPDYVAAYVARGVMTPDEVRFPESRAFHVDEISRVFGIPEQLLVGDLSVHHIRAMVDALERAPVRYAQWRTGPRS